MAGRPSSLASLVGRVNLSATRLVFTLLAIGVLGWSAMKATRRVSASRQQLQAAQVTLASFASLRQRYEPAVAAESIAWRRTWMELQALGIAGDERLAITQQVARAAELAGLRDVKVLIGPPDTTGSEVRLSTEGVQRKPASFSLMVDSRGGLRAVIAFLGQLPPSVAATQLSLVRDGRSGRHRISLAVYELSFANGPPTIWSSTERIAPRDGGRARPGG